jgi:hypothetical protein
MVPVGEERNRTLVPPSRVCVGSLYEDGLEDVDLTPSDDGAVDSAPVDADPAEPATPDGGAGLAIGTVVALLVGVLVVVAVVLLLV